MYIPRFGPGILYLSHCPAPSGTCKQLMRAIWDPLHRSLTLQTYPSVEHRPRIGRPSKGDYASLRLGEKSGTSEILDQMVVAL